MFGLKWLQGEEEEDEEEEEEEEEEVQLRTLSTKTVFLHDKGVLKLGVAILT